MSRGKEGRGPQRQLLVQPGSTWAGILEVVMLKSSLSEALQKEGYVGMPMEGGCRSKPPSQTITWPPPPTGGVGQARPSQGGARGSCSLTEAAGSQLVSRAGAGRCSPPQPGN